MGAILNLNMGEKMLSGRFSPVLKKDVVLFHFGKKFGFVQKELRGNRGFEVLTLGGEGEGSERKFQKKTKGNQPIKNGEKAEGPVTATSVIGGSEETSWREYFEKTGKGVKGEEWRLGRKRGKTPRE